ncbi:TetR/AcrR family transcriptional repressor of mexJK operon [Microbacterium sp. ZKA21]|jgi:TetR/AcrR family transcriptional repressor of mexJK operon|uniref:TetR/AcrR family transcriptional regulator n=1 Tax=Microbacterium sp. ZKA21 TaxID=3381694 RepID=UPI003D238304
MMSDLRTRGRPTGLTGASLLAVARDVLLENGYAGTSMEEIAKRARISKASLYREHGSKRALYAAVVEHWTAAGRDAMRPALDDLRGSRDVRSGLVRLAETMRTGILSPPVMAMRMLVTAEAATQPEVAAAYLEQSWHRNIRNLAAALDDLTVAGRLRIDDPVEAAEQFTWLVIGAPMNARMLGGEGADAPSITGAVDLFLARYSR